MERWCRQGWWRRGQEVVGEGVRRLELCNAKSSYNGKKGTLSPGACRML